MFLYSIFGGSDGQIPARGFTVLTLFGATSLRRATLAQRIQDARRRSTTPNTERRSLFDRLKGDRDDRGMIVTLFGGCEVKAPTLAEEYAALRGLAESGTMTATEIGEWLDRCGEDDWFSFTMFGVTTVVDPSKKRQLEALQASERAGLMPESHRLRLAELVEAPRHTAVQAVCRLLSDRPATAAHAAPA